MDQGAGLAAVRPERTCVGSTMTERSGGEAVAFRAEQGDDLVVGGKKSLGLAGRFEPAHDLFSSSCMPVRGFDPVVQPLVGMMVGTAAIHPERGVVAPELVGHHDPRLTADGDHHLVDMPFITRRRSIATDLRGDLRSKTIDPGADRLVADRHTAFRQQILNVSQAQAEPVIAPDRIPNHRSGKAVPLQG